MRFSYGLFAAVLAIAMASPAWAAVVFSDDFEGGTMSNWPVVTGAGMTNVAEAGKNTVPIGGTQSAKGTASSVRMARNLGFEVSGAFTYTSWIWDDGNTGTTGSSRVFNEVRGYTGTAPSSQTTTPATLQQLFAIGKFNNVTNVTTNTANIQEAFQVTKYQARVVNGTAANSAGWFNLNGAGSPNRSTGWHKFTIERLTDGTTLNFYVDDILSRTIANATAASMDYAVIGPGIGTQAGDFWVDGVSLTNTVIPEPASFAMLGLSSLMLIRRRKRA